MTPEQIAHIAILAAHRATITEQELNSVVADMLNRHGIAPDFVTMAPIVRAAAPLIKTPENGWYLCDDCGDAWVHIDEHCGDDGEYMCGDCYGSRR